MRKLLTPLVIAFSLPSFAQNVGIGTATPAEKLEVRNGLRSTVKISSGSFNDTTGLLLSNRNGSNQGTDFSINSIREEGLFLSSLSDLPGNTSANSLVIRPGGQIGVGIFPTAKLDINGGVKLQGLNLFEFGAGVAGKEVNAGKVGYNAFGQNGLTIVGGGTNVTNRAVFFYAEGGTTMNGPLNIGGPLRINGNAGTAGQVLTSNGTGDPVWESTAYGNSTRFGLSFTHNFTTGHSLAPLSTLYNLTPADVTIGANSFTINKTGLYHFDIILNSGISIPGTYAAFNFYFSSGGIDFLQDEPVYPLGATGIGKLNKSFSFDMHVTAGTVLSFGSYVALGTGGINTGRVFCHLVNE
ncbi:MAG: hypothetical protein JNK14_16140 [Chitinophagaceae bacterium]|nr:hypothetical protein [Chitinophagaceae bacterium]